MSRALSGAALQSVFAAETGEAFLILLTLSHPDLGQPIRVTSDSVATDSRGDSFAPYPFDLILPDDLDNKSPRARLLLDNIDRSIVVAIRNVATAPSILIEIVRAADPDTVEAQFVDFKLTNVAYDALRVEGNLSIEDFTAEPFPAATFSPSFFPGLF